MLSALTPVSNLPIKSIRIGRDSLTGASRGVCYVEMNTTVDAMFLHNQLLGEPLSIDDRLVSVSYLKTRDQSQAQGASVSAAANAALAAAQWTHQNAGAAANIANVTPVPAASAASAQQKGRMSDQEVERMAEYSASMYAKTKEEKTSYLEYYRNYYRNGGDADAGASQASVSAAVMPQGAANLPNLGKITVNSVEYRKYRKIRKT